MCGLSETITEQCNLSEFGFYKGYFSYRFSGIYKTAMLQQTIIYLAQGFVLNTKQFLNTNTRAAVNKILSYMHFSNKFVSNI